MLTLHGNLENKLFKIKKLAHVSNRLVIGVRGRIQPGMNGLQIKLSTNFTFTAENPYNLPLYSMPSDELNLVRQS